MSETPERKYALTKLSPGDYLLPSNDAQYLWRLTRDADGTGWSISFKTMQEVKSGHDSFDNGWICVEQCLSTRNEAMNEALRITKPT